MKIEIESKDEHGKTNKNNNKYIPYIILTAAALLGGCLNNKDENQLLIHQKTQIKGDYRNSPYSNKENIGLESFFKSHDLNEVVVITPKITKPTQNGPGNFPMMPKNENQVNACIVSMYKYDETEKKFKDFLKSEGIKAEIFHDYVLVHELAHCYEHLEEGSSFSNSERKTFRDRFSYFSETDGINICMEIPSARPKNFNTLSNEMQADLQSYLHLHKLYLEKDLDKAEIKINELRKHIINFRSDEYKKTRDPSELAFHIHKTGDFLESVFATFDNLKEAGLLKKFMDTYAQNDYDLFILSNTLANGYIYENFDSLHKNYTQSLIDKMTVKSVDSEYIYRPITEEEKKDAISDYTKLLDRKVDKSIFYGKYLNHAKEDHDFYLSFKKLGQSQDITLGPAFSSINQLRAAAIASEATKAEAAEDKNDKKRESSAEAAKAAIAEFQAFKGSKPEI